MVYRVSDARSSCRQDRLHRWLSGRYIVLWQLGRSSVAVESAGVH